MNDLRVFELLLTVYDLSVHEWKDGNLASSIEWTLLPLSDHIKITDEQCELFEEIYDQYLILIGVS